MKLSKMLSSEPAHLNPHDAGGEPQGPAALKGMLHVGGPSLSLRRKTM